MVIATAAVIIALAQPVPQPFPRPGSSPPPPPASEPARPAPGQTAPAPAPSDPPPGEAQPAGEPNSATLGMPVYPSAAYLASYDAGQGQRYYLFGTNASFAEIVAYYRTYLKQRGNEVFDGDPPTHMFELGRFREETMAYAPGITVKDYAWNGSEGYLHVKSGGAPQRFRTIIQVVPVPAGLRN